MVTLTPASSQAQDRDSSPAETSRQVWLIPIADERVQCAGKTVKSLENTCHT